MLKICPDFLLGRTGSEYNVWAYTCSMTDHNKGDWCRPRLLPSLPLLGLESPAGPVEADRFWVLLGLLDPGSMSVAELSGIDRGKGGGSTVQGAAGSQEHGVQKSWGTRSAIHGDILLYAQTEREIVRIPEGGRKGGRSVRDRGAEGPTGRQARTGPCWPTSQVRQEGRRSRAGSGPGVLGVPRGLSGGEQRTRSCPLQEGVEQRHHFCNGD